MARTHARADRLYRAVVTLKRGDREWTEIYGPYVKPGPARQQITRCQREAQRSDAHVLRWHREGAPLPAKTEVTGVVEYTDADWMTHRD